ncbi:MAG: esterase, partial [Rhodococcus sp. (in: high G+C Gram-positive bacteria)]
MEFRRLLSRLAHLSLEHDRAQLALAAAAAVGVAVLLSASGATRMLVVRSAVSATAVTAVIAGFVWAVYRPLPSQIPVGGYGWIFLAVCAGLVAGALLRRTPGAWRRGVTALAAATVVLAAGGQVNAQLGVYPTMGSLAGHRPPAVVVPTAFDAIPGLEAHVQSGRPVDSVWK